MATQILEDDHAKLAELLKRLQQELGEENSASALPLLDRFWALLAIHIRAEHLWLFPAILNANRQSFGHHGVPAYERVGLLIGQLRSDHNFFMDELGRAAKTCRQIIAKSTTEQGPAEKLQSILSVVNAVALRLELHNSLEEEQVYRWPNLILSPREQDDLSTGMKRELENLPARFRTE
jgi:hypothetical protein